MHTKYIVPALLPHMANLRTKILDFRGFDSSRILIIKGWNSHIHREFPGHLKSNNLSREILSREIGRSSVTSAGARSGRRLLAACELHNIQYNLAYSTSRKGWYATGLYDVISDFM